ncbi:hypothetical protein JJE00_03965 [Candidatus Bathyarchaeota archaeon]|nr:hypothetical protein [Candidatus Bathyarchaeota archaeon]
MKLQVIVYFEVFLLSIIILNSLQSSVFAQSNLQLEWEQHWETYGTGGTCNFGTHNFFVGDIDQDGITELITGGMMYEDPEHTYLELYAPLKIWNWNNEVFTLEKQHNWTGVLRSIYAADPDEDGVLELITAGSENNENGTTPTLSVWSWDNVDLVLKDSFAGISVGSIFVGNLDGIGSSEIVTAGTLRENSTTYAQLSIWSWDGTSLDLIDTTLWCASNRAAANSVYVYDLDNDGVSEIVTGGYDNDLMNSSGQLRIWNWDGTNLELKANKEWRLVEGVYGTTITGDPMGNTLVNNLKVGDVDGDGVAEIITVGFTYDNEKIMGQIGIWNWNGELVSLEERYEWMTKDITEIKALYLADVNNDDQLEIITSGATAVFGGFSADAPPEFSQLRVWSWNGQDLSLDYSEEWTIGEGVMAWNVAADDIDQDGTVEIITVGCMYVAALCDPDLRIWSIPSDSSNLYLPILVVGAIAILVITVILVKRKKEDVN